MAYQPSWVIEYQSYHCWRSVDVLFALQLSGGKKADLNFSQSISLKVNAITYLVFVLSNLNSQSCMLAITPRGLPIVREVLFKYKHAFSIGPKNLCKFGEIFFQTLFI